VVNVVDLMGTPATSRAPARPADDEFDEMFTPDRRLSSRYHGYPWLIHRLTYRRANHGNLHVRGYVEEGTTTTSRST
jgi:xylulose-5-phosphate/fructose-6-phosphate phosphoketolase